MKKILLAGLLLVFLMAAMPATARVEADFDPRCASEDCFLIEARHICLEKNTRWSRACAFDPFTESHTLLIRDERLSHHDCVVSWPPFERGSWFWWARWSRGCETCCTQGCGGELFKPGFPSWDPVWLPPESF